MRRLGLSDWSRVENIAVLRELPMLENLSIIRVRELDEPNVVLDLALTELLVEINHVFDQEFAQAAALKPGRWYIDLPVE